MIACVLGYIEAFRGVTVFGVSGREKVHWSGASALSIPCLTGRRLAGGQFFLSAARAPGARLGAMPRTSAPLADAFFGNFRKPRHFLSLHARSAHRQSTGARRCGHFRLPGRHFSRMPRSRRGNRCNFRFRTRRIPSRPASPRPRLKAARGESRTRRCRKSGANL